ncbi:hypothetical protein BH11MYX3_BH11MYX3_21370 [soil metagenome]
MATPDVDPWVGKTFGGRYTIKRRIGRGGMGVVYEAEDTTLDRRVAIKLIVAAEAKEVYLARFRREAKLASRITHEHLVHVYDVGTDAESSVDYMVMELVEGRDLGKELKAGPMSIERTIRIARQLLEGLHAIHEGGIVHRDIKPANVMLTTRSGDRDFVKLMDFGIARALGDVPLTATGHVVGTPSFMSPEQLRGQEVDLRTDLYAVGVTLFAMVAGELPFDGNTAMLAGAHVFQPPPSLARLRPETPPALIAAIERALAKAPADRFADAMELARALEQPDLPSRARATEQPSVVTVANRPHAKQPPRVRSRTPLLLGAVASAAVIGGVIWYLQRPTTPAALDPTTTVATAPPSIPVIIPDAAVALPNAADAALPDAGPEPTIEPRHPTKPAGKRPDAASSGPDLRCHCIPSNASDVSALCPTRGPSRCRCDMAGGKSLCPSKLVGVDGVCFDCPANGFVCPDSLYATYHLPGRADEPCSGWVVTELGAPDERKQNGHLECDVCPGVNLDRFKGHEGEPCSGFYWRTGEAKTGTLAHCQ